VEFCVDYHDEQLTDWVIDPDPDALARWRELDTPADEEFYATAPQYIWWGRSAQPTAGEPWLQMSNRGGIVAPDSDDWAGGEGCQGMPDAWTGDDQIQGSSATDSDDRARYAGPKLCWGAEPPHQCTELCMAQVVRGCPRHVAPPSVWGSLTNDELEERERRRAAAPPSASGWGSGGATEVPSTSGWGNGGASAATTTQVADIVDSGAGDTFRCVDADWEQ
jgi:hypothetical protein